MRDVVDELVRRLQGELGDDLHGVFYGDFAAGDYAVAYLHDGIREQFEVHELVDLARYLATEQQTTHEPRGISHLLGDLEVTVRVFERSTHVVARDTDASFGIFVGISADPTTLPPVVEAIRELEAET